MDGADLVFLGTALLKEPVYSLMSRLEADGLSRIDAVKPIENGLHLRRFRDFDEQRRAQLLRTRDLRVIRVQFFTDPLGCDDVLGADHLLDLKEDRVPVLKHQRDEISDAYPAMLFEVNDPSPELIARALLLVGR